VSPRLAKRSDQGNNRLMREDRDTDLFPWILGMGLLAAGAFGAVLLMAPPAAKNPSTASAAPPMPMSVPRPPQAVPAPLQAASFTTISSASPPDQAAPASANSPIWQCEVNGQKIFADSPCGAGASLRSLSETNRMNPTPIARGPEYATYSSFEPPPYSESYSQDNQSVPENTVYVAHPLYWRRVAPRSSPGHHPEPRGAPRAHGM
jgi:hypothetical protein